MPMIRIAEMTMSAMPTIVSTNRPPLDATGVACG
jgi:hypothetical protein